MLMHFSLFHTDQAVHDSIRLYFLFVLGNKPCRVHHELKSSIWCHIVQENLQLLASLFHWFGLLFVKHFIPQVRSVQCHFNDLWFLSFSLSMIVVTLLSVAVLQLRLQFPWRNVILNKWGENHSPKCPHSELRPQLFGSSCHFPSWCSQVPSSLKYIL